jgi:hypothetical protein
MTTNLDLARALFRSMVTAANDSVADVLRDLARAGELSTLETLFHEKIVDPADWQGAHTDVRYRMGEAILPLLSNVAAPLRLRARELVDKWCRSFKCDDLAVLRTRLSTQYDLEILRGTILRMGEALDEDGSLTADVKRKLGNRYRATLPVGMAEAAAATGNFRPLEMTFNHLASGALRTEYNIDIATELMGIPTFDTAPPTLGRSAIDKIISMQNMLSLFPEAEKLHTLTGWLGLLAVVKTRPEDWTALADAWTQHSAAPRMIAVTPSLHRWAVPVLRSLLDNNADIDSFTTSLPGKIEVPMLHRAAEANNHGMVEFLLEAGADPYRTVGTAHPKDVFQVAKGSETTTLLNAWRARRALGRVMMNINTLNS